MNVIIEIFYDHKERHGYCRFSLELSNRGFNVNSKKVKRLMRLMGFVSKVRHKRKDSSDRGNIGNLSDNIIKREFTSERPNQKWYTDVTEFSLRGNKLYLSPIIDGFNGDVLAFNIPTSLNFEQMKDMFTKAFEDRESLKGLILYRDQGWQYQHFSYQKALKDQEIVQSMSRKGNSIDNGLIESFFGTLKIEMFYGEASPYKNIQELKRAITEYIEYYNFKRIKAKLKGQSPVNYRNSVLLANH